MRRYIARGLLAVFLCVGAPAAGSAQTLLIPPNQTLAIMIKTALIALNHANITGNYSVLRDLAAPGFREVNSQARLADIFRDLRQRDLDFGIIIQYQPQLFNEPVIDENKLLQLAGFFATRPEQLEFNLAFQAVGGKWRLFGIRVRTQRVVEVAPSAAGTAPEAAEPLVPPTPKTQ